MKIMSIIFEAIFSKKIQNSIDFQQQQILQKTIKQSRFQFMICCLQVVNQESKDKYYSKRKTTPSS